MLHYSLSPLRNKLLTCIILCLLYYGPLEQYKAIQLFFVSSGWQVSRVYQVSSVLLGKTETSPWGSYWKSWDSGHTTNFHSERTQELGVCFHSFHTELVGRDHGEWIFQTITFILSSPQPDALSCQCSDSDKTEADPLGSPSKNSECWFKIHISLSLPKEKLRVGSFLPVVLHLAGGRDYGKWVR